MKFILKENVNTIHYTFETDSKGNETEWEFEPSTDDIHKFVDELVFTYSKKDLEDILKDEIEFPSDYEELEVEEQLDALKDLLFDAVTDHDMFDEDAYNFFYDRALEQYSDYDADPYIQNGVSPTDFY